MKIREFIAKIFSCVEYVDPISNIFVYKDNMSSFAGGSLDEDDILLVTNLSTEEISTFKMLLKNERCDVYTVESLKYRKYNAISKYPISHVVVLLSLDEYSDLTKAINSVYEELQCVGNYLIDYAKKGNCVITVISQNMILKNTVLDFIKGLSKAFAAHDVLVSGMVLDDKKRIEEIFPSILFLSSKYGQILTGEVLEIRK